LSVCNNAEVDSDSLPQKPDRKGGLNTIEAAFFQMSKKPKFITDRRELEKLAPMLNAPIKRQVFVCNGKSCSQVGSAQVKQNSNEFSKRKACGREKRKKAEIRWRDLT
jgi:hypothetical protein